MDDEDSGAGTKSPVKRLGSTRKLLFFNNIRLQLTEQLRCLEGRMEAQIALVSELQDYFRRRAEVELDYSKSLEKLAKSLQLRHKEQKQKREQWPLFSSYSCWQQLVTQTKNLSKDHAALSEVYANHLVNRLGQVIEDVQRIYRKCREIGYETHEEILRVLHELHTTMKTYHTYQGEFKQAENKLRLAENQRLKLESSLPKDKLDRSKKYRLIEKEVQKRKNKYNDAKLKALKAKNEYILCLEASNTTIHKYFVDDLSDLIDCMDFGFHNCISRALLMHISAEEGLERSVQAGLDNLHNCIGSLDSRLDKQRFLESNHSAFMIPKKFEFQGLRGDEVSLVGGNTGILKGVSEPELEKTLRDELEVRLVQLQSRVTSLRTESEEVWKTLETAERTLLEMLDAKDYDCSSFFGNNAGNESVPTTAVSSATTSSASAATSGSITGTKPPETVQIKMRADRQETEEFYMSKFREYLLGTSRIARLDAKQEHLRRTLSEVDGGGGAWLTATTNGANHHQTALQSPSLQLQPLAKVPRRKRIGRQINQQPKLFGGSLEEFLEMTNQEIPLVMKSCIRVINLYGLHHQGIFRVSGSQVEINNFRDCFERGEDPLADVTDASDINSVAGVLKLYLRELREPLFPTIYFEQFMELAQLESKALFVQKTRDLISSLPRPVLIVMRYLFAFLNHLSDFADENMMDPYNLAICFGPTLVPVPEDKDQVQYQNLVNELIKNIILFNDEIFPADIGSVVYEKYISKEPDECDVGDSPSEQIQEDLDSEVYPSEDESDVMEATAQFDFAARSDREINFKKGDVITLYAQVSNDWWRGSANGKEGLVPDKYIMLKMKDEDREKLDLLKSSSSEESMRRRASSSNDSVLSSATSSASAQNSPLIWPQPENIANKSPVTHAHHHHHQHPPSTSTTTSAGSAPTPPQEVDTATQCDGDLDGDGDSDLQVVGHAKRTNPVSSGDETDIEPESVIRRRTHCKSQSVGNPTNSEFAANRELWQRRTTSQIEPSGRHTPDLVVDLPIKPTHEDDSGNVLGPESPDMSTTAERFAKPNQCTLKKNTKQSNMTKSSAENVPCGDSILQSEKISQVKTELELVLNPTAHQQRLKPKLIFEAPPQPPSNKPQLKAKPQILRKPVLPLPVVPLQASPEAVRKDAIHN